MADYTAIDAAGNVGAIVTERSGTTAADTVEAGTVVLWRNTGAGAHVVTLTTNLTVGDLAVADRSIALAAGQAKVGRVPSEWGDVNRRCAVAVDGTASEVKYYILGGL